VDLLADNADSPCLAHLLNPIGRAWTKCYRSFAYRFHRRFPVFCRLMLRMGRPKATSFPWIAALNHELRGTGVSCTVACPGVTATGETLYQRMTTMSNAKVTNIALKALLARSPLIVIGRRNAFMAWSTPLMPRTLAPALANQLIKN